MPDHNLQIKLKTDEDYKEGDREKAEDEEQAEVVKCPQNIYLEPEAQ
jgi:hypothetical protein